MLVIYMQQEKYYENVVKRYNFKKSKMAPTRMCTYLNAFVGNIGKYILLINKQAMQYFSNKNS